MILLLDFSNSISLTLRLAAGAFDTFVTSLFLDLVVEPIVDAAALVLCDV